MTNKLPNKLSDLIVVALQDLRSCEEDDNYLIVMRDWHNPIKSTGQCEVCFAGAVMAKTLSTPINEWNEPYSDDFSALTKKKLLALNAVRLGAVQTALSCIGYSEYFGADLKDYTNITAYEDDPIKFHSEMNTIVKNLKGLGL